LHANKQLLIKLLRSKIFNGQNKITVLEGLGSFVDTHVAIAKPMELSKQLKQKYNYNGSKPANFPFQN
jgi:hypothetical protein